MDAISLILTLFLSGGCSSTENHVKHNNETHQVTTLTCQGQQVWTVWQRQCPQPVVKGQPTWWSRPFLLVAQDGSGFYLNQFAEVQAGHQVALDHVYYPACEGA
jgi:hypothetical protein